MIELDIAKEKMQQKLPELKEKYALREIGFFGSYVRNEADNTSDLDILVDFERPLKLALFDLRDELSVYLNVKVDLVDKSGLKPGIGQRILSEVIYVEYH